MLKNCISIANYLDTCKAVVTRGVRIHAQRRRGLIDRAAGHSGPCSLHCAHAERPQALQAVCGRLEPIHAEAYCWYATSRRVSCQSCQRIIRETSLAIPSCICSACPAMCLCQKADPADVFNFKWLNSSDNVPFPCADMYRYPKRSIALLISDDAVMSKVLLAKDRCEQSVVSHSGTLSGAVPQSCHARRCSEVRVFCICTTRLPCDITGLM